MDRRSNQGSHSNSSWPLFEVLNTGVNILRGLPLCYLYDDLAHGSFAYEDDTGLTSGIALSQIVKVDSYRHFKVVTTK